MMRSQQPLQQLTNQRPRFCPGLLSFIPHTPQGDVMQQDYSLLPEADSLSITACPQEFYSSYISTWSTIRNFDLFIVTFTDVEHLGDGLVLVFSYTSYQQLFHYHSLFLFSSEEPGSARPVPEHELSCPVDCSEVPTLETPPSNIINQKHSYRTHLQTVYTEYLLYSDR